MYFCKVLLRSLTLVLGAGLAAMNAQNLINNPGFESGMASWAVTSGYYLNTAAYSPDSTVRHGGTFSVRGDEVNDGSLGALQQDLTGRLAVGRQYTLSGWIKTQNVSGGGGAAVGLTYVDQHGAGVAGGGQTFIGLVKGTQDWTFFQAPPFTLGSMPTGAVALVLSIDFSDSHGTAWFDDLKLIQNCQLTTGPCITSPPDGSHPVSTYVVLSGVGTAFSDIDIIRDGSIVASAGVDPEGTWEKVLQVGAGPHVMRVGYTGNPASVSPPITINNVGATTSSFIPSSTFEKMRTADAILAFDPSSAQVYAYGPNYSHTALYLGGDPNGAPLIAEAVTPDEAGAFGQVRTVTLEQSTVYTTDWRADVYRRGDLSAAERAAVAAWAAGVTAQGLPYFNVSYDLVGPFGIAAALWDFNRHVPINTVRFNSVLAVYINNEKIRTDKFICSTLVWRSIFEGTGHRVDVSLPNNIAVSPQSFLGRWSDPAFINALRPYFVFPDTIALSGKLGLVP